MLRGWSCQGCRVDLLVNKMVILHYESCLIAFVGWQEQQQE